MKKIYVLYGRGRLETEIPDKNLLGVLSPKQMKSENEAEIIRTALANPIGSKRLRELSRDVKSIVIISSDNTRPLPSRKTLPLLLEELARPVESYDITVLIATGLHRPMTESEIEERFGKEIMSKCRIVNHAAVDGKALKYCGDLDCGRPLYLNRLALEADLLIAEGFIEPHFFAGFSGGRKSILPGIAGAETIMNNHSPQNIASEGAVAGNLMNNPIHNEALKAARISGLKFILNVSLNEEKQIIGAFAGDVEKAHLAGCEFVRRNMTVPCKEADIAVTSNSGYPLDRNVYQMVKGMDTASRAVKPGGIIIIAGDCIDGIGSEMFKRVFAGKSSAEELFAALSQGEADIDQWNAQVLARILVRNKVIIVSDKLKPEDARLMFMELSPDLDSALSSAFLQMGGSATVNVIPEGPTAILKPLLC